MTTLYVVRPLILSNPGIPGLSIMYFRYIHPGTQNTQHSGNPGIVLRCPLILESSGMSPILHTL